MRGSAVLTALFIAACGSSDELPPVPAGPRARMSLHWNDPNPEAHRDFYDIWGSSSKDVWAVGIVVAHWDGASWSTVPLAGTVQAVWGAASVDVWAAGSGIFHWDGRAWTSVSSEGTVQGLWGSGPSDVWAVGEDRASQPLCMHWDGTSWTTIAPPPLTNAGYDDGLTGVWGSGPSDVWAAVGKYGGKPAHWDGTSWAHPPVPNELNRVTSITGAGPGNMWVATAGGHVYHWNGHGSAIEIGTFDGFDLTHTHRLFGTRPNGLWMIGDWHHGSGESSSGAEGTLYQWDGARWRQVATTNGDMYDGSFRAVWETAPGDVWLARGTDIFHVP